MPANPLQMLTPSGTTAPLRQARWEDGAEESRGMHPERCTWISEWREMLPSLPLHATSTNKAISSAFWVAF